MTFRALALRQSDQPNILSDAQPICYRELYPKKIFDGNSENHLGKIKCICPEHNSFTFTRLGTIRDPPFLNHYVTSSPDDPFVHPLV